MPIVGFGSADRASAHMRWAERYVRHNNVPKATAHFGRALEYERRSSFGTEQEHEQEIQQIRKQAQNMSEQTRSFEENTRLLTVEMAELFAATYIAAIKKDPRTYDRSNEDTLDTVEWEDSYEEDFDAVLPEIKKGKRQKQHPKYKRSTVPSINEDQKKIAIEFEEEATKLGVLNEKQKNTQLNFYSYRGAYVRELFKRIADHLKKTKRSDKIDAWREKKYEFHKGYANPRGHGQGPLLTYPRKRRGPEVIDLSSEDEERKEPKERKEQKERKERKEHQESSPKSETPIPKILIVDLRTEDEIMHTNSIKKSDDDDDDDDDAPLGSRRRASRLRAGAADEGADRAMSGDIHDVCEFYRNKRLSEADIRSRRELIARKWVSSKPSRRADFDSIDGDDLHYLLELYDEHFFTGAFIRKIRADGEDLDMVPSTTLAKTAGVCRYNPSKTKRSCLYTIEIGINVLRDAFKPGTTPTYPIGGLKCKSRLECMQLTLEHEMIHLLMFVWLTCNDPGKKTAGTLSMAERSAGTARRSSVSR